MKNQVFKVLNEKTVPSGKKIISSGALWCFSADFSVLSIYINDLIIQRSILSLNLNSNDKIINAGFIEPNDKIFLFLIKNQIPILYFINIKEQDEDVVSFTLSSLHFHNNIINVFSPFKNSFCIISKEGISLHNAEDLSVMFDTQTPIIRACFDKSILLVQNRKKIFLLQFLKEKVLTLFQTTNTQPPLCPLKIFLCQNSAFVICKQIDRVRIMYILFQDGKWVDKNTDTIIPSNTSVEDIAISSFDQTILFATSKTAKLVDFIGQQPILLTEFHDKPLAQIVNDHTLYCNNKFYEFREDYNSCFHDQISCDMIAAVLRRKNGVNTGMSKLTELLPKCNTYSSLENILTKVCSPSMSQLTQNRFIHALQYCGITNPHLILLGILKARNLMGDSFEEASLKSLVEMMSKEECINIIPGLLSTRNKKLSKNSMSYLLSLNPNSYHSDPILFQNSADFIKACIDAGQQEKALNLIVRAVTDGEKGQDLEDVIQLYISKYGDNEEHGLNELVKIIKE